MLHGTNSDLDTTDARSVVALDFIVRYAKTDSRLLAGISFIISFNRSFIHSFNRSVIHSFNRSVIHSIIRSFIQSFMEETENKYK